MNIAGLQKTTLVDFPGKIAATVFTRGCTFRCPFCHNPELVLADQFIPLMDEDEIMAFFEKRKKQLQGVCITGGEPTIHKDIHSFIHKLKELGYAIKLDTNGTNPTALKQLIDSGDIDYIAMDIKAAPRSYSVAAGIMNHESGIMNAATGVISTHPVIDSEVSDLIAQTRREPTAGWNEGGEKSYHSGTDNLLTNVKKSISLIMSSGIDYEFRTTVVKPIHKVEDFEEIGKLIKGAKRYYIQNFVRSKHIDEHQKFESFTDEELERAKEIASGFVKNSYIR